MGWKKGALSSKPGSSDGTLLLQEFMCVSVCFQLKHYIPVFCTAHISIENFVKSIVRSECQSIP